MLEFLAQTTYDYPVVVAGSLTTLVIGLLVLISLWGLGLLTAQKPTRRRRGTSRTN